MDENSPFYVTTIGQLQTLVSPAYYPLWHGDSDQGDIKFWRLVPPPGYANLGDYAQNNYNNPDPSAVVVFIQDNPQYCMAPSGYINVWNNKGYGGNDCTVWLPYGSSNYVALGHVVGSGYEQKHINKKEGDDNNNYSPIPSNFKLVKSDFTVPNSVTTIDTRCLWSTRGSGGDVKMTICKNSFMQTFFLKSGTDSTSCLSSDGSKLLVNNSYSYMPTAKLKACCMNSASSTGDLDMCGIYLGTDKGNSACDAFFANYCKNNQSDELCGCYNVPSSVLADIQQPQCFYTPCSQKGYIPSNQRLMNCVSQCKQYINMANSSNLNFDRVSFNQYCAGTQTDTNNNNNQTTNQFLTTIQDYWLWILIVVIVFIVICSSFMIIIV